MNFKKADKINLQVNVLPILKATEERYINWWLNNGRINLNLLERIKIEKAKRNDRI